MIMSNKFKVSYAVAQGVAIAFDYIDRTYLDISFNNFVALDELLNYCNEHGLLIVIFDNYPLGCPPINMIYWVKKNPVLLISKYYCSLNNINKALGCIINKRIIAKEGVQILDLQVEGNPNYIQIQQFLKDNINWEDLSDDIMDRIENVLGRN